MRNPISIFCCALSLSLSVCVCGMVSVIVILQCLTSEFPCFHPSFGLVHFGLAYAIGGYGYTNHRIELPISPLKGGIGVENKPSMYFI